MPQGEAAKNILVAYQEEGMKPLDILRSSTYLSAKYMEKENDLGVIKKGAYADIIAVEGDIETDFSSTMFNVVFVLKDGEIYVDTKSFVKEIFIDNNTLKSYAGNYEWSPDLVITVSKYGNHLKAKAKATGQEEYDFFPKAKNVFYANEVGLQITFNVNIDGYVESLTLLAGGQESNAPKLEE